jgi:hypothetical protein
MVSQRVTMGLTIGDLFEREDGIRRNVRKPFAKDFERDHITGECVDTSDKSHKRVYYSLVMPYKEGVAHSEGLSGEAH